ncbi:hypothetical protein [Baaleninema simplex]|uniref:hypothetical protein n=1 Tax=Baaleninema simplex TaxID=2862350 RepID=UPI00035CCE37|nr:hypothetical protein [Baaleninema simplex]
MKSREVSFSVTLNSEEPALRIGIGKFTTDDEIDRAAEILVREISEMRSLTGG